MGTQGVHINVVLPWLIQETFCPALSALLGPAYNIVFPHRTLFHFICPYIVQQGWADSRAASPFSYYIYVSDFHTHL
jgi:hypothetical protein